MSERHPRSDRRQNHLHSLWRELRFSPSFAHFFLTTSFYILATPLLLQLKIARFALFYKALREFAMTLYDAISIISQDCDSSRG